MKWINLLSLGIVPIIKAIAKARRDKREQVARLEREKAKK